MAKQCLQITDSENTYMIPLYQGFIIYVFIIILLEYSTIYIIIENNLLQDASYTESSLISLPLYPFPSPEATTVTILVYVLS